KLAAQREEDAKRAEAEKAERDRKAAEAEAARKAEQQRKAEEAARKATQSREDRKAERQAKAQEAPAEGQDKAPARERAAGAENQIPTAERAMAATAKDWADMLAGCVLQHPEPEDVLEALVSQLGQSGELSPRGVKACNAFLLAMRQPDRKPAAKPANGAPAAAVA